MVLLSWWRNCCRYRMQHIQSAGFVCLSADHCPVTALPQCGGLVGKSRFHWKHLIQRQWGSSCGIRLPASRLHYYYLDLKRSVLSKQTKDDFWEWPDDEVWFWFLQVSLFWVLLLCVLTLCVCTYVKIHVYYIFVLFDLQIGHFFILMNCRLMSGNITSVE